MSKQTTDQITTVDFDEFTNLNEPQNVNVEDPDDADQPESLIKFSGVSSAAAIQTAADAETRPESHLTTFTIPVFERHESETIQRSPLYHSRQTLEESSLTETETNLLSQLELSSFLSSNITLQKALSEASSLDRNKTKHTDLPWVILFHILKHNLRWRDSILPELQLQNTSTSAEQPDTENTQLLTLGNILSIESILDRLSANQSVIHPLDIFVMTFSCCSHELKVIICQKLLMCKQAIPLIYRMPGRDRPCFTSLPLYSLVMECRTYENNADVIDAASTETKIIGFLRLGSVSHSKSSLLNGVLNADKNAPFCHRDCLLCQTKSLSMEGLIEATWFLPSGKETDLFKEVITFLNLRGDAQNVKSELRSFLSMCSTIVAMVDVSNLTDKKIIDVLQQIQKSTNTVVLALIDNSDVTLLINLKQLCNHFLKLWNHCRFLSTLTRKED